ncbi:hypothetical protein [Streptomyces sp. NBC_01006]|uniref:hypothetical protein n=1 Tax=Streptomyces sp. NBC_01006 TaxID=2903716 RepID=UPI00386B6BC5|nr:hypothetical protein OG509_27775 [Streptomyces sp. NBC_01006]
MKTPRQTREGRTGGVQQPPPGPARPTRRPVPDADTLARFRQHAGNAAFTQAMHQARYGGAAGPAAQQQPSAGAAADPEFELPPYLMALEAGGLSTAYGLTDHVFVRNTIASQVGHGDGAVADIHAELIGRPESFFGAGRAFAVQGKAGDEWYDVTVRIGRAAGDRPPTFKRNPAAAALPAGGGQPQSELEHPEGKDTKVDVQHNTAAAASSTGGGNASKGVGGVAFGLGPVAPGVWFGPAATANAQPWQSSRESRHQKNVAEPRVLRSDKGSVEVPRTVQYEVRVKKHGDARARRPDKRLGTLTQRVPTEHLVPVGTGRGPLPLTPLNPTTVRRVHHSDSLAAVAVSDNTAPHEGGGGLFDAVASVLHPSVTAPGAPGRGRLFEATSTATVLEDLPRLLRDGVVSEDLYAKDGRTASAYRLRALITDLAPAWGTGKTQLRTHQQAQTSVTEGAGKGRAFQGGLGPAVGFGATPSAAVVRGTAMPVAAARKARFTVTEQTVSSRQGAEVRGEKALYYGQVSFIAVGIGPLSPETARRPGAREAGHSMNVWISLRADEAKEFGLPLPPGMTAGEFVKKPTQTDADGNEVDVERHLPFGGKGANVALSRLDTRPMLRAVLDLFTTDPSLAGYLPAFGATAPAENTGRAESEAQRRNYRELMTTLSETNLRINKDQLLSTGIRVRLRRKTSLHAHDVQLRVKGALSDTAYAGDIKDWSVRSHAGVTSNSQSGRSSSRSLGGLVLGQARLVPGALSASARYERHGIGTRRNQAGPTGRTDIVSNGSDTASAFEAALKLDVDVTMTSRPRKLARSLTPGTPGQSVPDPKSVASLDLREQGVRLLTPTEFTVDRAGKDRIDSIASVRRAQPGAKEHAVKAEGIGDLATLTLRASVGEPLRDWQLVETLDGEPIRALALRLLSRAAAGNKDVREDPALATEGLAPRLAIEERFGERAIQGALRQAASSGWVVKNLRYPRRLAGLNGAVGTRLALANPRLLHKGAGPGTETFVLGGHQSGGQRGKVTTNTVQFGVTGSETGPQWRAGQGLAVSGTTSEGDAEAFTVSGTVERNAHTPKKAPLYLVQCDVLVNMVAEVGVTARGSCTAKAATTLPAAAGVWLTEAQLPPRIREQVRKRKPVPAAGSSASASASAAATASAPPPVLGKDRALGFGMIEDLPDFVPLLEKLRTSLAGGTHPDLVHHLLPRRQLKDRNDNVQRLLRVLDRDGSAGLLSSAMDGGVTVELFDGRNTPYWAVFKIERTGDGAYAQDANDGRDMEYITSAVSQQANSHDKASVAGIEGILGGSARPDGGAGQPKSLGGAGGLGYATGNSRRSGAVNRGQLGMKSVADSSAKSAKMNLPIRAKLELYKGDTRLAFSQMNSLTLTHRILRKDLEALSRVRPVPAAPLVAPPAAAGAGGGAVRLDAWRDAGVKLPLEAQVNGFTGAHDVRKLVSAAVKEAGGGHRFRTPGQAAAYALDEAVSTEWMIAALPLLTASGADLPPVHASGPQGQDLRASVHTRLRDGQVLGLGDKMTFETVGQSHLEAPRPSQKDGQSSSDDSRAARPLLGAGLLNANEFRLNQLLANGGGSGGAADASANSAGSLPLHKPKMKAVLVQFTVDVTVVATVTNRLTGKLGAAATAVREATLSQPVVIRMPEPVVRRMLAAQGDRLQDPGHHLTPAAPPPAAT